MLVDGRKQYKSTVLVQYSSPLTVQQSRDRLKRIRGGAAFDETGQTADFIDDGDSPVVAVEDPVATLLRCNSQAFLAIVTVIEIRVGNSCVTLDQLHEPTTRLRVQLMRLAPIKRESTAPVEDEGPTNACDGAGDHSSATSDVAGSGDLAGAVRGWTDEYEQLPGPASCRELEGRWVEVISPEIRRSTRVGKTDEITYCYGTTTSLRATAALLFERIATAHEVGRLPNVPLSMMYPYRNELGEFLRLFALQKY